MKLLFATDLHGSDVVFEKCLRLITDETADLLLLGGDLAGKGLVPLIQHGRFWMVEEEAGPRQLRSEDDREDYERAISAAGLYPYRCDESTARRLKADQTFKEEVLRDLRIARLARWLSEARIRIGTERVLCNLGNDDPFYLNDVIYRETGYPLLEERDAVIGESFVVVSCGYANRTPWNCPRDISEHELQAMLRLKFEGRRDMKHVIANLHCPPVDTSLDRAPKLDATLRPLIGVDGVERASVGSWAVRWCIEQYQPALALHGHIHEGYGKERLGRTTCVNPGSAYYLGELQAALIHLSDGQVRGVQLVRER